MKVIYQKPFEKFNIPLSEDSELWDIYVSKLGSTFIFDGSMWFVLFDTNLKNTISEKIIDLISQNGGLYKEIIDDFKLLDFQLYKEVSNDLFFKALIKNINLIWNSYEQRTISSVD